MKKLAQFVLSIGTMCAIALVGGLVFSLGFSLIGDTNAPATPGLDFIARSNGATNSAAYLAKLSDDLEAQGRAAAAAQLYAAGNARFQQLYTLHPRTLAAIRRLLQLDGFIPDGSGNQPDPFDPTVADANIDNLGTIVPKP